MKLDPTTIGALFGFLGLVVTTIGGVWVATRTNRSEKTAAAQQALEATRDEVYEQRLTFRDEQISALKRDLENCKIDNRLRIEELESELDKRNIEILDLRGRNK